MTRRIPLAMCVASQYGCGNGPMTYNNGVAIMRIDAIEALCNAAIGLVVSWAATWLVLGYTAAQSIAVTLMFFALSFIRAFVLRSLFRRFQ